jgi:hypothetical protein
MVPEGSLPHSQVPTIRPYPEPALPSPHTPASHFFKIHLNIILSLRSSPNMSYHVSHPYKTTGRITILYILIFIFLDSKLEDKTFCTEWQQTFPDFNLLLISSE